MKFQEVLYFLEDEEKRNDLIYKLKNSGESTPQIYQNIIFLLEDEERRNNLKNSGENSVEIQAFHAIITCFNLLKPPPGIHQETLLQNTFRFCEAQECFQNFRLVSKSWKHAIENMRFRQSIDLNEILEFELYIQSPIPYGKYFQAFKKVSLEIDEEVLEKWNSFSKFILENVKKINSLQLESDEANTLPQNFDSFLLELCQNSQITLNRFCFSNGLIHLPIISLPNVTLITQYLIPSNNDQISSFELFMKRIIYNCEYLEELIIVDVDKCPNIAKYIAEHYSQHCIKSSYSDASIILPVQVAYYESLQYLEECAYPSTLEYVKVWLDDLNLPFGESWRDYKSIFALCPKLKGIAILDDNGVFLDNDLPDEISLENKNIWKERILYFKLNGITLMNKQECYSKFEKLRKKVKWGFKFLFSAED